MLTTETVDELFQTMSPRIAGRAARTNRPGIVQDVEFAPNSAPFDNDLIIATRMRDTAFKRVLRKASPGLQVKIDGPGGSFVLHRKSADLLFETSCRPLPLPPTEAALGGTEWPAENGVILANGACQLSISS